MANIIKIFHFFLNKWIPFLSLRFPLPLYLISLCNFDMCILLALGAMEQFVLFQPVASLIHFSLSKYVSGVAVTW